jgi:hypothetical protein
MHVRTPPFQQTKLLPESEILEEKTTARVDGSESQNK